MYNKIFTKILDSSIWLESDTTRIAWLTMIAAMDENGFCAFAAVGNFAGRARISLEAAREAIRVLESPDAESSDPENEGRRIERVPGGWMVLNASKYREMVTRAIIQEQTRARVARFRAGKKQTVGNVSKHTHVVTDSNASVTLGNDSVTPSDTDSQSTKTPLPPRGDELPLVASPDQAIPSKPPILRRVEKLFGRTERRKLSRGEERAWKIGRPVVEETTEEEWAILEWWFSLPDKCPGVEYRRTDMAACLNNWHAEIAKARKNKGQAPAGTPVTKLQYV